jgi:hypothetical protein
MTWATAAAARDQALGGEVSERPKEPVLKFFLAIERKLLWCL